MNTPHQHFAGGLSACLSHGESHPALLDFLSIRVWVKACDASPSKPKFDGVLWSRVQTSGEETGRAETPLLANNSPRPELGAAERRNGWGRGESDAAGQAGKNWAGLTPPQPGAGPQEEQGRGEAREKQTLERQYGRNHQSWGPSLPADQETSGGELGPRNTGSLNSLASPAAPKSPSPSS